MPATRPIVIWNVERLFRPGGSALARALGATSVEGWTAPVYRRKIAAVGGALRATTNGVTPAFIALIEVEDERVVEDLCDAAGWPDLVNVVPPEERVAGYDVALAYDPTIWRSASAESWTINNRFSTRDVLFVRLQRRGASELAVMVVHWPSRKLSNAEPLRIAAGAFCGGIVERTLKFQREELFDQRGRARLPSDQRLVGKWNTPLMIVGDFNDEPWDPSVESLGVATREPREATRRPRLPRANVGRSPVMRYLELRPRLYNPTWELLAGAGPYGTVRFGGAWALLDQVVVSGGALGEDAPYYVTGSLHVFPEREVQTPDGLPVTLRTRGGDPFAFDPATGRGASDHLPLLASVYV